VETIVIDETAVLASYAERTEWLRRQSQYQEGFPLLGFLAGQAFTARFSLRSVGARCKRAMNTTDHNSSEFGN
jgi:hypothetical protein